MTKANITCFNVKSQYSVFPCSMQIAQTGVCVSSHIKSKYTVLVSITLIQGSSHYQSCVWLDILNGETSGDTVM